MSQTKRRVSEREWERERRMKNLRCECAQQTAEIKIILNFYSDTWTHVRYYFLFYTSHTHIEQHIYYPAFFYSFHSLMCLSLTIYNTYTSKQWIITARFFRFHSFFQRFYNLFFWCYLLSKKIIFNTKIHKVYVYVSIDVGGLFIQHEKLRFRVKIGTFFPFSNHKQVNVFVRYTQNNRNWK